MDSKYKKEYHPTFGATLRELRERYGVSAIQLVEHLGTGKNPYQLISTWETGRREPSFVQLCKIADYFGVTTDYLLGRKQMGITEELSAFLISKDKNLSEEDEKRIIKLITALLE
ncbi:MAG: helix-turn-helix transcriptional regulator [Clostridiales bacterium]|nr:helix-turn-helix transcriptional regulator [Clostridiales bacterium]